MLFFQALRGLISGHVFRPCRACREHFEKIEAEKSYLFAVNSSLNDEKSRLDAEKCGLIAKVAALETTASTAANAGHHASEALCNAHRTIGDKRTKINTLNKSVTALQQRCSQKDGKISLLEHKLANANQEHEMLKTSVQRYRDEHESKEKKILSLVLERDIARAAEAAAIENARKAAEEKDRALQREREAVIARGGANTARDHAITARDQVWGEYYDAQQTIEDLRRQVQELQATNSSAQSTDPAASTVTSSGPEVWVLEGPRSPAVRLETTASPATEASQPPSRAASPDIAPAPNPAIAEALDTLTASMAGLFIDPDADLNAMTASLARLSMTSNADNENSDMADPVPSPSSSITSVRGAGHQGYCTSFTSAASQYTQPLSTGSTDASSGFMQQLSSSVSTAPPSSSGSTDAIHTVSLPEEDSKMDGVETSDNSGAEDSDMGGVPAIADASDARDCVMSAADEMTGTQVPADSTVAESGATNDDHDMEDSPPPSNGEDGPRTGCSSTAQPSSAAPTNSTTAEPSETRSPFASVPPRITYGRSNHLTPSTPAYTPVGPRASVPSQSPYTTGSSSLVNPPQNRVSQTAAGTSGPSNPTSAAPLYNPFNRLPSSSAQPATTIAASPSQAPPYRPGVTPVPFSLQALRTPGAVIAPRLAGPAIPGLRPSAPRNALYNSTPAPAATPAPAPTPTPTSNPNPQAPVPTAQTTTRPPAPATTSHDVFVRGSVRLNMSQPDGENKTPEQIAQRPRRPVASRVPRAGVSVLPPGAPAVVPGAEEAERRRREESEESEEL